MTTHSCTVEFQSLIDWDSSVTRLVIDSSFLISFKTDDFVSVMAPPSVKLTDDEIRTYIIAFHRHDINKDGVLDKGELVALLQDVKLPSDPEKLDATLEALDLKGKLIDKTGLLQVLMMVAMC